MERSPRWVRAVGPGWGLLPYPPPPPHGIFLGKASKRCWEKKQHIPGVLSTASERLQRGGGGKWGRSPLRPPSQPGEEGDQAEDLRAGPGRGRRLGARARAGEWESSRPWRGWPAPSGGGLVSLRSGTAAAPTAQPDTGGGGGSLIWSSGMRAGGRPPRPRLR